MRSTSTFICRACSKRADQRDPKITLAAMRRLPGMERVGVDAVVLRCLCGGPGGVLPGHGGRVLHRVSEPPRCQRRESTRRWHPNGAGREQRQLRLAWREQDQGTHPWRCSPRRTKKQRLWPTEGVAA